MRYYLIDETRRQNAINYLKSLDLECPMEVVIKPHEKSRSLSQNRLMWSWIPLFAEHCGYTPNRMHKELKIKFLGVEESIVGGVEIKEIRSTKDLTVAKFATYLRELEGLALDYEIKLPHPEDYYYAMMDKINN